MALFPPISESPEAVRESLAPIRHDFAVAVYAGGNAFAVGAIIRVAHNFLAREVLIVGDAPFYEKASMGMEKYERVVRLADEEALFDHVKGLPGLGVREGRRAAQPARGHIVSPGSGAALRQRAVRAPEERARSV